MPTLGEYLKKRDPEKYGAYAVEDIDKRFAGALQNEQERPRALRTMRRVVPEWNDYNDDELGNFWVNKIAQGRDVSQAEQQQKQARAAQIEGFTTTYDQVRKKVGGNLAAVKSGKQPQSDTVDAVIEEAKDIPPPQSVVPDKDPGGAFSKAGGRIPVIEDFREFAAMAKARGLEMRIPGRGFGTQVIAVDPQSKEAVAALHQSAHYDPKMVEGWSGVGYLTGSTSPLQQQQAAALAQTLGINDFAGSGLQPGYGFRELGADVGAKARQAVPGGMGLEKAASYPIQAGAWLRQKANEGTAAVMNKAGNAIDSDWMRQWAADDTEEARLAAGTVKDQQTFRDNVDSLDQREVKKLAGQGLGRVVGEAVDIAAPTEADAAVSPVLGATGRLAAKVGAKVLPDAVVQAIKMTGQVVGDKLMEPVLAGKRAVADATLTKAFANNPSALGIADEPARLAVDSATMVKRTAPDLYERQVAETMNAAAEPVFKTFGVTDAAAKREAGQQVWQKWTTAGGRQSMTPMEAALADVWQPFHRAVAPENVKYNPLHPAWGQDPRMAAKQVETAAAQTKEAAGGTAWRADPVDPTQAGQLPGVRALAPEQQPFATANMKPHLEIGEDIANRAAREGSKPWERMSPAEISQLKEDFRSLTLVDAVSRTARTQAEKSGLAMQSAANEVAEAVPSLMQRFPERYMRLDDMLRQSGVKPGAPGSPMLPPGERLDLGRNAYGGVRQGDLVIPKHVEDRLKSEDLRIVTVEGSAPRSVGDPSLVIQLPSQFRASGVDGMVMDRYTAQALQALGTGSAAQQSAKEWAKTMDHAFGLAQIKRSITGANPGFEWRVLVGDTSRHAMSEGMHGLSKEVRTLTADISNANRSSPLFHMPATFKGQPIIIDGAPATLGQVREALEKYGSIRGNQMHEMAAEVAYSPGMGRLVENTLAAVPGGQTAIKVGNKAAEIATLPGKASGWMADQSMRNMFSLNGRQLNGMYSAGDGLRMVNMVSQMTRGVEVRRAAQNTRLLMMDFGDTNAAQEALKPFVPFIKFWSSGIRGAFEVAKKNPRNFSRLHDAARLIENWDQAAEGGALDPRTKRREDMAAGRPRFEQGGTERVLRWENPWQDVVDILSAVGDTKAQLLEGDKNARGLGQFVGPTWQKGFSLATGRDLTTGRPVIPGIESKEYLRSGPTLAGKFAGAVRDGRVDNPKATAAYLLAKYLSPTPVLTNPADLAIRSALRLPSSTARTPDNVVGDLSRAIPNYMFGVRQTVNDPVATVSQNARSVNERLPEPTPKANAKREAKGRQPKKKGGG